MLMNREWALFANAAEYTNAYPSARHCVRLKSIDNSPSDNNCDFNIYGNVYFTNVSDFMRL